MSKERDAMNAALHELVVPTLRAKGFKGSLPHFRRVGNGATEVLTFQFDRHGGSFVMQIGRCSDRGFTTHWGKHIPPQELTAWDLAPNDKRIQPRDLPGTDGWFRFDSGLVPLLSWRVRKAAQQVLECLSAAESWWLHEAQQHDAAEGSASGNDGAR
jgi:Domain of unknown function (DUF4304)